jgi:hypothetical protein
MKNTRPLFLHETVEGQSHALIVYFPRGSATGVVMDRLRQYLVVHGIVKTQKNLTQIVGRSGKSWITEVLYFRHYERFRLSRKHLTAMRQLVNTSRRHRGKVFYQYFGDIGKSLEITVEFRIERCVDAADVVAVKSVHFRQDVLSIQGNLRYTFRHVLFDPGQSLTAIGEHYLERMELFCLDEYTWLSQS